MRQKYSAPTSTVMFKSNRFVKLVSCFERYDQLKSSSLNDSVSSLILGGGDDGAKNVTLSMETISIVIADSC